MIANHTAFRNAITRAMVIASCLSLFTTTFLSGNTVTLPEQVKAQPGRLVKIAATTDGKQVKWVNGDPDRSDLISSESGLYAIFSSPYPGEYAVYAYTAMGDIPSDAAMCIITVGNPGPPQPPNPTPPNPTPPTPNPPNPNPTPTPDNLSIKVQFAYNNETDPQKANQLTSLIAIYRQGASLIVNNQGLKTWGDLFDALSNVAKAMGVTGKIINVQKVIASELLQSLPTGRDKPLDAAGRKMASEVFSRVADSLERVK